MHRRARPSRRPQQQYMDILDRELELLDAQRQTLRHSTTLLDRLQTSTRLAGRLRDASDEVEQARSTVQGTEGGPTRDYEHFLTKILLPLT